MARIRIYGRTLNTWVSQDERGREIIIQKEIEYTDFDETGSVLCKGSEDFSPERQRTEIEERWIYTWDGVKRNKGGYRWFEDRGLCKFRKNEKKAVKQFMQKRYNAEILQLR
ncbi:MAG: hypothetical protein IKF99_10285 [Oscillospiraceae bacterium]|nr:hypothetical protein [Oscillospiraceae bacterium]